MEGSSARERRPGCRHQPGTGHGEWASPASSLGPPGRRGPCRQGNPGLPLTGCSRSGEPHAGGEEVAGGEVTSGWGGVGSARASGKRQRARGGLRSKEEGQTDSTDGFLDPQPLPCFPSRGGPHFPTPDPSRACDLLWPTDRGGRESCWFQARASRGHVAAALSPGPLLHHETPGQLEDGRQGRQGQRGRATAAEATLAQPTASQSPHVGDSLQRAAGTPS